MSGKPEYRKGPVCGIDNCKSRQYHEQDGLTWCKKGHQQEGIRTQQDEDDFGTQGRKTRIRKDTQERISQIYRGHSATSLYLQAYQLILWKQCHALIHTVGLPGELEAVVKDLWALRLQLLKNKTDATSEEDTVFSSQPQTETETEREDEDVPGREYKVKGKAMPGLIETLGLCYLGVALLRLSVGMGEMHRWAVREDVPFIRAVRFVPTVMKQKLPAEYLKALDTTSPLEPDHLRKTIHNLSLFYTHHFKLVFPPLNAPLLLYQHIRDLALPISLHPITLHLSTLLSISFDFPFPGSRQRISSLPELQLISLLTVAIKLYHPFDTRPRHARSLADPAALTIDWPTWVEAQNAHDTSIYSEGHFSSGSEINVTEADVMKMTREQLDEYMDYYERTFICTERVELKSRGLPKELLDMFPIGRLDGSSPAHHTCQIQAENEHAAVEQRLKTVMGSMKLRPVASEDSEEPVRRIGSFYKRFRRVEDLEGYAKMFYEKVAEGVGVKVETLVLAVGQIERRLIMWGEARVKEVLEEEEGSDGVEDQAGEAKEDGEDVQMEDDRQGDDFTTDDD